jgi:hypothetical protein
LLVGLSHQPQQHDQRHSVLLLRVTLGGSCDGRPMIHEGYCILRRSSCCTLQVVPEIFPFFFFINFPSFSFPMIYWAPNSFNRFGMRLYSGTASSGERKMLSLRFPARTSTPSVRYPRSSSKPLLHPRYPRDRLLRLKRDIVGAPRLPITPLSTMSCPS